MRACFYGNGEEVNVVVRVAEVRFKNIPIDVVFFSDKVISGKVTDSKSNRLFSCTFARVLSGA